MIKLLHGDCVELLKTIPDNSVDLVLTDPPYLLNVLCGGKINDFGKRELIKNNHIAFINNSFDMESVFSEIKRVSKTINIIMFCSNKQISSIMKYWEDLGHSATLLVWDKPNPIPLSNGKYISNLEFIVYVRGKGAIFNNTNYNNQLKTFRYSSPNAKKRLHPTEKPVEMIERLINTHSNKGDVVLDMFMGSGTTGMACLNTERDFIGIEIDENFFNICERRLGVSGDGYIPSEESVNRKNNINSLF
jgi:DNA modification methylase